MKIILASASPRRRELLEQAGIPFEILIGSTQEKITKERPCDIVEELSLSKAQGVASAVAADAVVIGADTIVAKDQEILGKPKDAADAFRMLSMLQGDRHQVYTGVTLIVKKDGSSRVISFHERTDVFMAAMDEKEILDYIATGEPFDKAGAYGIQGRAGIFIEKIEGDYYNVVGLPISRLYRELKNCLGK
ncbi:MAG: Maf family protein [Hominisplanchenecus sp.]